MTKTDVFDEIAALRPIDEAWAISESGQKVLRRAFTGAAPATAARASATSRGRWRRPRSYVFGVLVTGTLVAGTAAAAIIAATPDNAAQAGCYSTLSGQADMTEASSDLVQKVGPIQACKSTWNSTAENVDTTNLVLCVTPSGGQGVFPAPAGMNPASACGQIGQQPETTKSK